MPPVRPPSSPRDGGTSAPGSEDFLDGEVPDPDAPASASERAHAASFAELIDKAMTGRPPPALASDERALLEISAVVRSAAGHAELAASQRRAVIDDALVQALGARTQSPRVSMPMDVPRSRAAKWLPWGVAAAASLVAAAAIALLWARAPQPMAVSGTAAIPAQWRSRPSDALVGEIQRDAAADAAARIDSIYSDRLDGYRDATLLRRGGTR